MHDFKDKGITSHQGLYIYIVIIFNPMFKARALSPAPGVLLHIFYLSLL